MSQQAKKLISYFVVAKKEAKISEKAHSTEWEIGGRNQGKILDGATTKFLDGARPRTKVKVGPKSNNKRGKVATGKSKSLEGIKGPRKQTEDLQKLFKTKDQDGESKSEEISKPKPDLLVKSNISETEELALEKSVGCEETCTDGIVKVIKLKKIKKGKANPRKRAKTYAKVDNKDIEHRAEIQDPLPKSEKHQNRSRDKKEK